MSEQLCKINICDIDLNDLRYKISFTSGNIESLAQSIKDTGLINPPLVRPLKNRYIIVAGFNRVQAYIKNREDTIVVYKTKSDTDEYQYLLKSITALSFKRELTYAELIVSIKSLNDFLDVTQIADKSSAIFNARLNIKFVQDLLNIGTYLPEFSLNLIHQGNLSIKTAKRLLSFKNKAIKEFLIIFSKIKASNNKQLEIVQFIDEISKREAINIEDFFQNQKMQKIILDENREPVLKTRLLREFLYEKRFPTLFQTRQTVQKRINKLKLGNKVKMLPPENFESQNYSISFTLKNYNEFKTNIKTLNTLLESRELKEIFDQSNV
jgi:ParB family transcriptional regulator, chromosome partitioning protein